MQDQDNLRMTIKVFKKDEPTFDVSRMLTEDQWRVYVTDYLSTGPTHGTPLDSVALPVLKRNLRLLSGEDGADAPTDSNNTTTTANNGSGSGSVTNPSASSDPARRYDAVRAKEALEFKVAVGDYKMQFQANSDEYWHQPAGARAGLGRAAQEIGAGTRMAEETARHRDEGVKDGFVVSNGAIRQLSKGEVEGREEEFRRLREGGAVGVGDGGNGNGNGNAAGDGDGDEAMEDA